MNRPQCCRCKKNILGSIKVDPKNTKDLYCEKCYKMICKERATNEHKKQERIRKTKSNTRKR